MKKFVLLGVAICLWAQTVAAEAQKEVVIFSQPCHFCDKMKEALNGGIIKENPDIRFTILDIQEEKNNKLLQKFAKQYDLQGQIGLPLLFVGRNYMMGWGENAPQELETYLEQLRAENVSRVPVKIIKQGL